jgi:hypothetical protein
MAYRCPYCREVAVKNGGNGKYIDDAKKTVKKKSNPRYECKRCKTLSVPTPYEFSNLRIFQSEDEGFISSSADSETTSVERKEDISRHRGSNWNGSQDCFTTLSDVRAIDGQ